MSAIRTACQAVVGHDLLVIFAPDRTPEGLVHSPTCRPIYSSSSANPVIQPALGYGSYETARERIWLATTSSCDWSMRMMNLRLIELTSLTAPDMPSRADCSATKPTSACFSRYLNVLRTKGCQFFTFVMSGSSANRSERRTVARSNMWYRTKPRVTECFTATLICIYWIGVFARTLQSCVKPGRITLRENLGR